MGIFAQQEEKEVTTPVEEAPVEAVEATPDADFEDRSLYNCDMCGGDGLIRLPESKVDVHCPQCNGKGRLN